MVRRRGYRMFIKVLMILFFFCSIFDSLSYANCIPETIVDYCVQYLEKNVKDYMKSSPIHKCINNYCSDKELINLIEDCYNLVTKSGNDKDKFQMSLNFGYANLCIPDAKKAREALSTAFKYAKTDLDKLSVLVNFSIVSALENNPKKSLKYLEEAEKLAKKLNDAKMLEFIKINKCSDYKALGLYDLFVKENCE